MLTLTACAVAMAGQTPPPAAPQPAPAKTVTQAPATPAPPVPAAPSKPERPAAAAPVPPAALNAPALSDIHTVYLLTMGSRLDQYLATELARRGVFAVTTDPHSATAVFTDELGPNFERRFSELYAPKEVERHPEEKEEKDDPATFGAGGTHSTMNMTDAALPHSSVRGKGNLFLVDRASLKVVWSGYAKPRGTGSQAMNKTAAKFASELHHQLKKLNARP